jgi:2-methylcitrate dehydratase PrpD
VTPLTGLEAKFSLRQTIAFAFGDVDTGSLHTYTDDVVADTRLHNLRRRIEIDFRAEWQRAYAEMEVQMKDGRTFSASHDANKPADDYPEQRRRLSAKFMSLVEPIIGPAAALKLLDLALRVDQLGSMRELMAAAAPSLPKV